MEENQIITKPINVLIADDHWIFIGGLKSLIDAEENMEVIATAAHGQEVMAQMKKYPVDVLILDVNMPVMNGIETLEWVKQAFRKVKVLVLTSYNEVKIIENILNLGADGYICKNTAEKEVINAIETVMNDELYIGNSLKKSELIKKYKGEKSLIEDEFLKKTNLTKRELEILKLVALEHTSKEIAEKLFISEETTKTHRKNLTRKLGVKSIIGLVRFAYENELV